MNRIISGAFATLFILGSIFCGAAQSDDGTSTRIGTPNADDLLKLSVDQLRRLHYHDRWYTLQDLESPDRTKNDGYWGYIVVNSAKDKIMEHGTFIPKAVWYPWTPRVGAVAKPGFCDSFEDYSAHRNIVITPADTAWCSTRLNNGPNGDWWHDINRVRGLTARTHGCFTASGENASPSRVFYYTDNTSLVNYKQPWQYFGGRVCRGTILSPDAVLQQIRLQQIRADITAMGEKINNQIQASLNKQLDNFRTQATRDIGNLYTKAEKDALSSSVTKAVQAEVIKYLGAAGLSTPVDSKK